MPRRFRYELKKHLVQNLKKSATEVDKTSSTEVYNIYIVSYSYTEADLTS